ncbi:MAG: PAS domain S-box protein, partial [Acidobacteriota bacterium]
MPKNDFSSFYFNDIERGIENARFGDHIAMFYSTVEEWTELTAAYLRVGLKKGYKSLCIYHSYHPDNIRTKLNELGVDAAKSELNGDLVFLSGNQTYEPFDQERIFDSYKQLLKDSLAQGYPGIWATADMGWIKSGYPLLEDLDKYEYQLNHVFYPSNPVAGICQYCSTTIDPEMLKHVSMTHPWLFHAGHLYRNHYYVEQGPTNTASAPEQEVEKWLQAVERDRVLNDHISFLGHALELSSQPFVAVDIEGRVINCNPAFSTLSGYTRDELLNKTLNDVITQYDQRLFNNALQKVADASQPVSFQIDGIRKDGAVIPVEIFGHRVNDFSGKTRYYYGFITDITERRKEEMRQKNQKDELEKKVAERTLELAATIDRLKKEIAQRKKAEKDLQESEAIYRAIFENASASTFILDEDGTIMLVNSRVSGILGYTKEQMEGKMKISELVGDQSEKVMSYHNRRREGDDSVPDQYELIFNDGYGKAHSFLISVGMIPGNQRSVVSILEITEQVELTRQVKVNEALFRGMFDNMRSGAVIYEAVEQGNDFIITGFNQASEMIEKTSSEEVLGRKITEAFPGVKSFGLFDVLHRVWETGQPEFYPANLYADGKTASWRENYVFKLETGEVVAIYDDVTERMREQKALEASEERYRRILETANEGTWIIDAEGKTVYVNQKIEEILGYSLNELMGQPISDYMADVHLGKLKKRSKDKLTADSHDTKITGKDGREIWAIVSTSPIRDVNGKYDGMLLMITDITARKQAEKLLSESESRYRTLYTTMSQGVVYHRETGEAISANPVALQILGITEEEIQGRTCNDKRWGAIYPDGSHFPGSKHPVMVALKTRQVVRNVEMGVYNPIENRCRWINISATPEFRPGEERPYRVYSMFEDITDRKIKEELLARSEAKYRELFETSVDGIAITDMEGNFIDGNESFLEQLGFETVEYLFDVSWKDVTPTEYHESELDLIRNQLLVEGYLEGYEKELIQKNGSRIFVSMIMWLRYDDFGNAIGVWAIVRDITEQKLAEKAFKDSEKRFRELFETSIDGIAVTDMNGFFIDCNQAYLSLLGYDHLEEIRRKSYQELTPVEYHDFEMKMINEQTLVKGYCDEYEKEYFRNDGSRVPVSLRAWLRYDDQEQPMGMWVFVRDVSERKKAEKAILASQSRYRELFETSIDGIVITDMEGNYLDCNHAYLQILGLESMTELNSKTYMDFTPREYFDLEFRLMNEQVLVRGYCDEYEKEYIRQDGQRIPVSLKTWARYDENDEVIGLWTFVRDISERKIAQEDLRRSEEQYRLLFDTMVQGVIYYDNQAQIKSFNKAAMDIIGIGSEQFIGQSLGGFDFAFIHEDGTPYCEDELPIRIVLKTGKALENHLLGAYNPLKGEYIWANVRAVPQFLPGTKELYQVYVIFEDITDRRKAEIELMESEAKYKDLFFNMMGASTYNQAVFDENGRLCDYIILDANEAAEELWGINRNEAVGRSVTELIPELLADEFDWLGSLEQVVTGQKNIKIEQYSRKLNRWLLVSAYSSVSGYFVTIVDDITERKTAEIRIMESEAKYRNLFYNMMNAFTYNQIVVDESGHPCDYIILEANEAAERMIGLTPGQAVGCRVTELIPGIETLEADWIGVYGKVALEGKEIHFQQYAKTLGKWLAITAYSPKPGYFVIIHEDITDRVVADNIVRESEAKYRSLFENMMSGYMYNSLIFVDEGQPIDFVVLEVNDTVERMTGLRKK